MVGRTAGRGGGARYPHRAVDVIGAVPPAHSTTDQTAFSQPIQRAPAQREAVARPRVAQDPWLRIALHGVPERDNEMEVTTLLRAELVHMCELPASAKIMPGSRMIVADVDGPTWQYLCNMQDVLAEHSVRTREWEHRPRTDRPAQPQHSAPTRDAQGQEVKAGGAEGAAQPLPDGQSP